MTGDLIDLTGEIPLTDAPGLDCPEVDPGIDQRIHDPHTWLDLDGGRWRCGGWAG